MNIRKSIHLLKLIFKDREDRKHVPLLTLDLLRWIWRSRGGIYFFYIYRLQERGRNVSDFMTIGDYLAIHDELDPVYYRPMLEDKIIFDRYIHSFHVPCPEMLAIIEDGRVLWMKGQNYSPLESITDDDLHAYCKNVTAFGGTGVYKLDVRHGNIQIDNEPADLDTLRMALGRGKYILQRTIVQHDELNRLNPSCVNTIRVYTVNDGTDPLFYGSVIRIGVHNSIVDNVTSKNLATGIRDDHYLFDMASTGTNPPEFFSEHPDSGVVFGEFKVPYLAEAYELCRDTHKFFGDFFFIAWDVAITPAGPVIIEGNPAADLIWMQLLYGGQKERFNELAEKFRSTRLKK